MNNFFNILKIPLYVYITIKFIINFIILFQFPFDMEPPTPQTPQRCPTGQKTPLWAHFVECN